jgi:hypothetical protein
MNYDYWLSSFPGRLIVPAERRQRGEDYESDKQERAHKSHEQ